MFNLYINEKKIKEKEDKIKKEEKNKLLEEKRQSKQNILTSFYLSIKNVKIINKI